MLEVVGYKKEIKVFRHKRREVLTPIYKDTGKAKGKEKIKIERE